MRITVLAVLVLMTSLVLPHGVPASGSGAMAPAFVDYAASAGLGAGGGEPSIGVDQATGAVFFQAGAQTLRVTFDDASAPAGASWSNVASPMTPFIGNLDPIAWTDAATGRTFAGGLEEDCSLLFYTDDDGGSWTPMPDSCTAPAFDHETIGSGPYHAPAPPAATYPRAVYYCAQGEAQQCAVSWDGGLTFNAPAVISTACTNAVGHVKVGPDGTAYVPAKGCGNSQAVMVSTDNGLTWTTRPLADSTLAGGFNDPSVATTTGGWLYGAWLGKDNHARVALSKDQAQTWGATTDLSALAGLGTASFVTAVAGDDARAAIAFLGSTGTAGFSKGFAGAWDLYVAQTTDAGATWTVTKATSDPVQVGWICTSGTTCDPLGAGGDTARNLLDFIGVASDARGRVLVAFADGCTGACATGGPNTWSALATIARQTCGPSLYAAVGEVEGAAGCPTGAPPAIGPLALHGAYYAHGLAPVQDLGLVTGFVVAEPGLSDVAPSGVPKVATNGATNHGSNTGTVWDANWVMPTNGRAYAIDDATVTVRLWVSGAHDPTAPATLRVALFDANPFGDPASPIVQRDITAPAAGAPAEVDVTFTHVSATIVNGLQLYVDDLGNGDAQVWYDSALTPTGVTIS
ncbi:MAG: hypothetical protein QOE90_589 [Thermoplasmata archaeon]|nr:hypothetical protein [Thermoplasmata archaeon]